MRKIIKDIGGGGTLGITFSKEERLAYGIEKGDIVEINNHDFKIIKKKKRK
ncbi:MAG: hypothetical protein JSW08_03065 [archaeon]|nr:MAG: hypothetical protein JSW08_03065 [archaeon]